MDHKHDRSPKWGALFAWISLSMLPLFSLWSQSSPKPEQFVSSPTVIQYIQEPAKPKFHGIPEGDPRKQAFIDYFLPLVEDENNRIAGLRKQLESTQRMVRAGALLTDEQLRALQSISEEFGFEFSKEIFEMDPEAYLSNLLIRVDEVPVALAIAQSAIESGWGTSRFSVQGNNFFGHMCEAAGCGISSKALGPNQEALKFSSPRESVHSYIANLNSNPAYTDLRQLRAELRNQGRTPSGCMLANGLTLYSERGKSYIAQVKSMIRENNLETEDACKLKLVNSGKKVISTEARRVPKVQPYQLAKAEERDSNS